ncbi:MAG: hypothetical protein AAF639_27300, partial [Chloroflexota bacterium]
MFNFFSQKTPTGSVGVPRPTVGPTYLAILIFIGCLVLISLDRANLLPFLRPITTKLYLWAMILSCFALLAGVINVAWVHLMRIQSGDNEWPYSLILLATLFITVCMGLLNPLGTQQPILEWIFLYILTPIQSSLFAIMAFFILAAAYRFLRLDAPGGVWLLTGALLILLVQTPIVNRYLPDAIKTTANWVLTQPVMATLRGVVMGSSV